MANHNIRNNTFYQRLLDELRNEDDFDNLDFREKYEDENPGIIAEIINLMQRKASIVSVRIRSEFLQSISYETIVALFDAIVTLPNLQEIWIGDWDFNPVLLREFVIKLLLEGRKLTHFDLFSLDVGDEIGAEIVKKLQNFKTLKHVTLRTLNLSNKTAFAIADWLKDSSCCLEDLDLQYNPNIDPEGGEAIRTALENNFILEEFCIWNNDRVIDQKIRFYTNLNRHFNRYEMMRRVGNGGGDDDNMVTRDAYINNMIETSNAQYYGCNWHGSEDKLKLSLIYYWIRMNPFCFTINES